jgi:hypothetical protein
MKLLRLIDNTITYPYNESDLKYDFPNTSFPEVMLPQTLLEFGVYQVNYTTKPNEPLKNVYEDTPILVDGNYYENWQITDCTPEEVQIRTNRQWEDIRVIRNQYLTQSDWTQLPDSPLTIEEKADWATYRQELRDVTQQSDPFNIIWPIKP